MDKELLRWGLQNSNPNNPPVTTTTQFDPELVQHLLQDPRANSFKEAVRLAYFDPLSDMPSRLASLDRLINMLEADVDAMNLETSGVFSAMLSEHGLRDTCAEVQLKNATLLSLALQHNRALQSAFLQLNGFSSLLTLLKASTQSMESKSKYLTVLSAALGNYVQGLSEFYALQGQWIMKELLQEPCYVKKTLWIIHRALRLEPENSSIIWKDVGVMSMVKNIAWKEFSTSEKTDIIELIDMIGMDLNQGSSST